MKALQKDIEKGYAIVFSENKALRDNVEGTKTTIFKTIAIGATVAGGIGLIVLGGPIGLGLFAAFAEASPAMIGGLAAGGAAGGGIGGLGIGAATKKWFPRRWFGEQTALKKAMKRMKRSLRDSFGGEIEPSDNGETSQDNPLPSPVSNAAISTVTTTTMPNNVASASRDNTVTLSDHNHVASAQNATLFTSGRIVTDAIISNGAAAANRGGAVESGSDDFSPQMIVNVLMIMISIFWMFYGVGFFNLFFDPEPV